MDEKTIKTILETLAKEIRALKLDIYLRDIQIEDLKKELAEAKGGENDG